MYEGFQKLSTYLKMLQEQRSALYDEGHALLTRAVSAKRELTAEESRQHSEIMSNLTEVRGRIEKLNADNAQATQFNATMRGLADAPVDPDSGYSNGEKRWLPGLGEYRNLQAEQRAVGTAGAFIPVEYYGTFWDQLRKRVGVLNAGPVLIDVEGAHSVKVPLVNASVTVGTIAEAAAITPSDPGLSNIQLTPKKLAAMTLVDREAVEDSNPALLTVVQNSLVKDFAVALDAQLAAGDGTGSNMTGLLNLAGVTAGPSLGANGASLSATAGFGFLADTLSAYEQANADPDKAAWLMHARTWASVRKITDSQGRPIFAADPTQSLRPTLLGKPVFVSNSLPIAQTVGTSSDCSTIILADFSQVVVAVARGIEVMMSTDFAFNTDQVAVRVTGRYDIGSPQPTAIVKTVGVRP